MKTTRVRVLIIFVFSVLTSSLTYAFQDTTSANVLPRKSSVRFTTRIHSLGMFSYGGRIACENPSFDVNFIYQRKHWGYFLFKAMDLYDHRSDNNFMLTTVFTNIKLGKVFTVTPHVGFLLEQIHSAADRGSDVGLILITTAKISDHLRIDHSAIVSNMVFEPQYRDWTNRIRVMYQFKHLDLTYFTWHNNDLFDNYGHISAGVNISFARINIGPRVGLTTGVTGLLMLKETDLEDDAARNGLVFSVACQMQ
jgi:hypothetical protein